ncbi:hypothetical protein E4414_22415 (plasmid) [Leptospira interrogans]|uniref:Uncharacterized protein n=2 Tax=Leptospira interrogans TaxID=173 RepID=A0A0F6H3F6_LEPIR|nr:hypothetical protein LIL_10908 [Leptospira interrogans serovar Linhai str. 56609]EKO22719.1 hypothetical protein LEP1GSC104_1300 [Leptospira interrogans str. UI 12621]EKR27726.1 hypothetical protein LEP1GSC087_2051 [Leptospira interrogans serovar Bataviae str. L1111]EMJ51802.1 hypothetical protein LEP1GSC111_0869 [Leptospira interrogans str. UT126]EMN52085.1 hypothetical protein LEP1GSC089_3249 [Leptospira interrogans serovar Autumnalis str. LP101]EMN71092.1 hypothetical protein LEP1GSC100_
MYFKVLLYSTSLIRSCFSETGLSALVNKLKERNVIQSIIFSPNLLTPPPSLPLVKKVLPLFEFPPLCKSTYFFYSKKIVFKEK